VSPATFRGRAPAGPIAIVLLALAAATGGWIAGASAHSSGALTVVGELRGRVSVVSENGGKVCIAPTGGDADRCSGLYRGPSERTIVVGDTVSVAIAELRSGPAETTEIFILEP
jgi:hypothetical protein